jgi:hypothetical protein
MPVRKHSAEVIEKEKADKTLGNTEVHKKIKLCCFEMIQVEKNHKKLEKKVGAWRTSGLTHYPPFLPPPKLYHTL